MNRNKYTDNSWSVGNGYNGVNTHCSEHGEWLEGIVCTRWGFVDAYSQGDESKAHHSSLRFMWGGRMYARHFKRKMTRRSLAIFARRFAKEISEES